MTYANGQRTAIVPSRRVFTNCNCNLFMLLCMYFPLIEQIRNTKAICPHPPDQCPSLDIEVLIIPTFMYLMI